MDGLVSELARPEGMLDLMHFMITGVKPTGWSSFKPVAAEVLAMGMIVEAYNTGPETLSGPAAVSMLLMTRST